MRELGRAACRAAVALAVTGVTACGGSRVRDPRAATTAFARAVGAGDAPAVYALLDPAARRALSREDVARLVADEKSELADAARALLAPEAHVTVAARLRFADGEEVGLEWAAGSFNVASGGTLPGGAPTPAAALEELRRAIARRSYPALLRVVSPATRGAIEQDLRTLTLGLEHSETLLIHTTDDTASALVPGGHHVSLKRIGGIWHVEDFD